MVVKLFVSSIYFVCMDFENYEFKMTCTPPMPPSIRTHTHNDKITRNESEKKFGFYINEYGRWHDLTCTWAHLMLLKQWIAWICGRTNRKNMFSSASKLVIFEQIESVSMDWARAHPNPSAHEFRWLHQKKEQQFDEEVAATAKEKIRTRIKI